MEDLNNNIIEAKPVNSSLKKSRKYSYIALGLGVLCLLFSLICFIEYVFNILSIVCGLGAFVFAILGINSDRKGSGFFGAIISIIGIVISLFLLITSIRNYQDVSNQAKNTSEDVGIYLVDKRPIEFTYNIDVNKYILQGSYLYDYNEDEKQDFITNISEKWKQEKVNADLKVYLADFILIPDEFFESEGYYIYHNIDLNDESFDKESLYYNFIFIYFDKDNIYEHDLYLYTFEKYQEYSEIPDEDAYTE